MRHPSLNLLIILIIVSATGIYRWYENVQRTLYEIQPHWSVRGWSSWALPFVLYARSGTIGLDYSQFIPWLYGQNDMNRTLAIQNVIRRALCQFHTVTDGKITRANSCCKPLDLTGMLVGVNCYTGLGLLPPVTSLDLAGRRIPVDPPTYQPHGIYVDDRSEGSNTRDQFPCPVNFEKRRRVYRLLRHWIQLAEEHKLVWWLNHGTLLGAMRNDDFIPYDHDADISVLSSAVPTIQQLATKRANLSFDKINLISQEQSYCLTGSVPTLNCQSIPVRYQMDQCAFCGPIARLYSEDLTYLDIFVTSIEVRMDAHGDPVDMGILDQLADHERGTVLSYALEHIFPLTTCNYMGLKLPCPRRSDVVLAHLYGKDYMQPVKRCDPQTGQWYYA